MLDVAATASRAGRQVGRFPTSGGRTVYRLPLEVFPGMFGNAYLVTGGGRPILVDSGSGRDSSNRDLLRGLEQVGERWGEAVEPADLGALVVTHGHIDHFGGLRFLRRRCAAGVAIHVLDRRVIASYRERLLMASRRVEAFLAGAGVGEDRRASYLRMYLSMKEMFEALPVEVAFEEGEISDGELAVHHVPGHCPGQVVVQVDDVLLTADHLLDRISPHISPEEITQSTGLGHYLESLDKVERLEGVRMGLGGHGGAIEDVAGRAGEIRREHLERLERVLELCAEPRDTVAVSRGIFGRVRSYHVLLAVLEAGALVEHLYQRGELVIENYRQLDGPEPAPRLYRRAR